MFDGDVCVGNQALKGKNRAVADADLALARLARVGQGEPLRPNDPDSDAVKTIQRGLIVLGYSTFTDGSALVDGKYQQGTERGVRQFQTESALAVTGVVDQTTLVALEQAVSARLAELDQDDGIRQRDILDRTVDMTPAQVKARYQPAVTAAAALSGVKESVLAAIMVVESGGGGNNRPKFEPHHFPSLSDLHAAVAGVDLVGMPLDVLKATVAKIREMPIHAGENGLHSSIGQRLLDEMAGGDVDAPMRQAIATVQTWSFRVRRELSSSWGWGQVMGWHTVRRVFRQGGVALAGIRSLKPEIQIGSLGRAISLESSWRAAAQKSDKTGDFSHFAAAYNGAAIGTPDNDRYAGNMAKAASAYAAA